MAYLTLMLYPGTVDCGRVKESIEPKRTDQDDGKQYYKTLCLSPKRHVSTYTTNMPPSNDHRILEKADSPTAHNSATHAGVREVNCHAS
jgi:hypothetical protein